MHIGTMWERSRTRREGITRSVGDKAVFKMRQEDEAQPALKTAGEESDVLRVKWR